MNYLDHMYTTYLKHYNNLGVDIELKNLLATYIRLIRQNLKTDFSKSTHQLIGIPN